MRHVLCSLFIGSLITAPLWAEAAPEPAVTPAPVPAAPAGTAPAAKDDPALVEAIESVVDEDEATRKKAFLRLEAATEADIPTLEKYTGHEEAEIRKQVSLLLQRLKRGTAALLLKYPDGTPAAGQKVSVKLYEIPKPVASDKKNASAPTEENVNGMKIQVNGNAGGQVMIMANGRVIGNNAAQVAPKEVFSGELTADAEGKVVIGRFNDGDYNWTASTQDPLPAQNLNGSLKLETASTPQALEVRRGISARVTVVDEAGKPVPGAVVMNMNKPASQQMKAQTAVQMLSYRRSWANAETDEKGVASLEKINRQELTLVAIKRGYDLAGGETIQIKDGETATLTLQLVKCKTVEYTLAADLDGTPLAEARLLAVPTVDAIEVLGQGWTKTITAADMAKYIEKGALDLGTTDAKGEVKAKTVFDLYILLAFVKGEEKVNTCQFQSPEKTPAEDAKVRAKLKVLRGPVPKQMFPPQP